MPNNAAIAPQSYLFVPGSRPARFERALSSGADAVIVDLEDAVEPAAKDAAREAVAAWVSRSHPVLVRINGRDTRWFEQDAKLAALDGVADIVIPKAERPDDVVAVVESARRKVAIFPLIETAQGMWSAMDIAKAPCVKRLMFGTLDFIAEMGMDDDRGPLNPHRAQLALVSRVAGLDAPVDGVTPDVHDVDRLTAGTLNGKQYGFGAKLCIHPAQVAAVHACYSPSERELDWAARVVDAMSRAEAGAITVDGKMVDRLVVLRAQRLLGHVPAMRRPIRIFSRSRRQSGRTAFPLSGIGDAYGGRGSPCVVRTREPSHILGSDVAELPLRGGRWHTRIVEDDGGGSDASLDDATCGAAPNREARAAYRACDTHCLR